MDPATHSRCTFGGMIGNNSCGTHSVMGGTTVDNVIELDVLTYDGTRMTVGATTQGEYQRIQAEGGRRAEIYRQLADLGARYGPLVRERFPNIPRRISGYNLDDLLPGRDMHVARALTGTEGTCVLILEAKVRLPPDPPAHALLVIGYDDAPAAADHVPGLLSGEGLIALECFDQGIIDNIHKHGEHGMHTVLFGHFGQGCAHTRLDPDLETADGIARFRSFIEGAGDLIVRYGGSLTGEHGDGQLRTNQLTKMYGPELVGAFAEFKGIFDPGSKMNPGKVVAPYRPDQNLQWGTDYRPRHVEMYFQYPQDEKGFADAANRCFGIGLCGGPTGAPCARALW